LKETVTKENLIAHRFPGMPEKVFKHRRTMNERYIVLLIIYSEYSNDSPGKPSTLLRKTFLVGSRQRTLSHWNRLSINKQKQPKSERKAFNPSNWSQARREISENNFYLCREYYNTEKDQNHEEWQKSKKKWMGKPFIAKRKKLTDRLSKSKRRLVKASKTNLIGDTNGYRTFDQPANLRRSQILQNFKQIQRIITKNYMKKKNPYENEEERSENHDYSKEQEEIESVKKMNVIIKDLSVTDSKVRRYRDTHNKTSVAPSSTQSEYLY